MIALSPAATWALVVVLAIAALALGLWWAAAIGAEVEERRQDLERHLEVRRGPYDRKYEDDPL